MDRSAAGRIAPTRRDILAVLDNARDTIRSPPENSSISRWRSLSFRVVLGEWDAVLVEIVAGLLAIGAARFCVHN